MLRVKDWDRNLACTLLAVGLPQSGKGCLFLHHIKPCVVEQLIPLPADFILKCLEQCGTSTVCQAEGNLRKFSSFEHLERIKDHSDFKTCDSK